MVVATVVAKATGVIAMAIATARCKVMVVAMYIAWGK